jgi:hypothetical protein
MESTLLVLQGLVTKMIISTLKYLYDLADTLDRNSTVVQVACGSGGDGRQFARQNFKSLDYMDITRDYLKPVDYTTTTNIKFTQLDIESSAFADYVKPFDIVLYTGHLMFAINPAKILADIFASNAKHLFISAVSIDQLEKDEAEVTQPNLFPRTQIANGRYSAYSPTDGSIVVNVPNISWTKKTLTDNGFTIQNFTRNNVWTPDDNHGYMGIYAVDYFIYATR